MLTSLGSPLSHLLHRLLVLTAATAADGFAGLATGTPQQRRSCYVPPEQLLPPGAQVPSRVLTPTPHEQRLAHPDAPPLPDSLDWRNVSGTSYTGKVSNQMLPSPCGSCWAFASSGALADRVSIATGGLHFDVSPQGLLDCAAPDAGSCNGGSHELAYAFAHTTGLTDSSCLPYRGMDHSNWGEVACRERMCRNCDRFGTCSFVPYNRTLAVRVAEHGTVLGVDAMRAEIAARGPIACSMYAHAELFEDYTGGLINDTTRYPGTTHVVVVAGWCATSPRHTPPPPPLTPPPSTHTHPPPGWPPPAASQFGCRPSQGSHRRWCAVLDGAQLVRDQLGRARLVPAGDGQGHLQHGVAQLLVGRARPRVRERAAPQELGALSRWRMTETCGVRD